MGARGGQWREGGRRRRGRHPILLLPYINKSITTSSPLHTHAHTHTLAPTVTWKIGKIKEKKKVDSLSLLQLNPVKEKMMRDRKQEKKSHLKLYVFGGKKCAYIKEVNV